MPVVPSPVQRSRARFVIGAAIVLAGLSAGVAQAQSGGAVAPSVPPAAATPTNPSGAQAVFPVPGPHKIIDGFGAGRGHQGADIFASCGQPEVAVAAGRVVNNSFQGRAGNYVVIRSKAMRRDFVYMHLEEKSALPLKSIVAPGQQVGTVGDTGNASGCHLHFEIWKGKWYGGGRAMDPIPSLTAWDAYS